MTRFRFHIVILYKVSFHLIGHTIWFYKEIRFSYFEPPLLFCNGDLKNENFNSLQKYRVRPIKWKGFLHRLTICIQKFSQHIPEESVLKLGLFFSDFEGYMLLHPNTAQKCRETHSHMTFTQNCFKSTGVRDIVLPIIKSQQRILYFYNFEKKIAQ